MNTFNLVAASRADLRFSFFDSLHNTVNLFLASRVVLGFHVLDRLNIVLKLVSKVLGVYDVLSFPHQLFWMFGSAERATPSFDGMR